MLFPKHGCFSAVLFVLCAYFYLISAELNAKSPVFTKYSFYPSKFANILYEVSTTHKNNGLIYPKRKEKLIYG